MSLNELFDHRCDIYHIRSDSVSPGFGLPERASYSYGEVPDIRGVPCHFGMKYRDTSMQQKAPANEYYARVKLALPAGTDIRLNDRVVDLESGLEYTAQVPRRIRGSHLIVFVKRTAVQEGL